MDIRYESHKKLTVKTQFFKLMMRQRLSTSLSLQDLTGKLCV